MSATANAQLIEAAKKNDVPGIQAALKAVSVVVLAVAGKHDGARATTARRWPQGRVGQDVDVFLRSLFFCALRLPALICIGFADGACQ
jgi:hypothetical protein